MASPEEIYREFIKRTHRTLGAFLALTAWSRDLDCVAIDRDQIVRFWGLSKRVEDERLRWLQDDLEPFFPYVKLLYTKPTKFGSVFLSRREYPTGSFSSGPMSDKRRIDTLTAKGLRSAMIHVPGEVEILAQLTAIIHGLAEMPSNLPAAKEMKAMSSLFQ